MEEKRKEKRIVNTELEIDEEIELKTEKKINTKWFIKCIWLSALIVFTLEVLAYITIGHGGKKEGMALLFVMIYLSLLIPNLIGDKWDWKWFVRIILGIILFIGFCYLITYFKILQ